ncbi:MAG: hypothetical protein JW841_13540 [Deltaproteobacteria bacterium]|nr:hypothetical protein [Deltaproteobacteria bacterium]
MIYPKFYIFITAAAILACSNSAQVRTNSGNDESTSILATGGDQSLFNHNLATIIIDDNNITVFGAIEVPGNSRLQAAFAMIDAVTRAELAKAVAVSIVSLEIDVQSDTAKPKITNLQSETTNIFTAKFSPMQRAWQRIQRGDENILALRAKTQISRKIFDQAVTNLMQARGLDLNQSGEVMKRIKQPIDQ